MNTPYFNILAGFRKSRLSLMLILFCAAFFLGTQEAPAQDTDSESILEQQLPPGFMDSVKAIAADSTPEKVKSPGGAVLRSLALPGWGQFYTGHKVRGSLTAVLETAFFAGAIVNYRDRNRLRDRLSELENEHGSDWPVDDPERVALNTRIKNAQQKGGDYLAYGLTTLLLSVIDSYVSAHLYRFKRSFQVSLDRRIALSIRF